MSKERMERVRREKYQELLAAGKLLPGETLEEYFARERAGRDSSRFKELCDRVDHDIRTPEEKKRDYDAHLENYLREHPRAQVCVFGIPNGDDKHV